ncbi:MAG TPA: glycolate oxidase subunit GlcF [Caulobacteraceae bacterium]|jgi:glycolate oxidase iron-sulfur subunit|nr:glycolate oxidase subunit GlcF [Caulobacteraceae bacterium]
MRTDFSPAQLQDPEVRTSEQVLRACVHCGFCTATCPTYVLLGDELDSPRGRIYLIKDMLEGDRTPTAAVVKHIDRCLSCLSCVTACPSGVDYRHLIDHARQYVEQRYVRSWSDRLLRRLLAALLPHPRRFRLALRLAQLAKPFAGLTSGRTRAMLQLAPRSIPAASPADRPQVFPAAGPRRMRVALLNGCAQQVVGPGINEATIRLLIRHGCEVVVAPGAGCCGALVHHLGKTAGAKDAARANIDAWMRELDGEGLDAVAINASGCGTAVKDYAKLLHQDPAYAAKAARMGGLARDVSEVLATLGLQPPVRESGLRVAYHAACSLTHGQRITGLPPSLLRAAGYMVVEAPEAHLCCGSAGTYNLLQPEIATRLRDRKVANIAAMVPDVIAAGNLGCITQIASGTGIPVVHTVELLDWATGGNIPRGLAARGGFEDQT